MSTTVDINYRCMRLMGLADAFAQAGASSAKERAQLEAALRETLELYAREARPQKALFDAARKGRDALAFERQMAQRKSSDLSELGKDALFELRAAVDAFVDSMDAAEGQGGAQEGANV